MKLSTALLCGTCLGHMFAIAVISEVTPTPTTGDLNEQENIPSTAALEEPSSHANTEEQIAANKTAEQVSQTEEPVEPKKEESSSNGAYFAGAASLAGIAFFMVKKRKRDAERSVFEPLDPKDFSQWGLPITQVEFDIVNEFDDSDLL